MPKAWAKYEVDFISHPKFRALSANAICLWVEGKNYCDENMTDGLIPTHIVKQFRFSRKASIDALLRSCGPKGAGDDVYAPLWEAHPVGYKMHGYLEYNDCREVVLARIARADAEREKDKQRKADARAAKKAKQDSARPPDVRPDIRPESGRSPALDRKQISETSPVATEQQQGGGARAIPMAPIHDRSHRQHAVCGRICLHASLFGQFVRRRNTPTADQDIRKWAERIIDDWTTGAHAEDEPGDEFDFWRAQYDAQWPATVAAAPSSKLPAWAQRKAQA